MKRYVFLFFILLVVGLVRAEERLQNPIAFSQDGNIYLSDTENSYALTNDASESLFYYMPRWSADGQTLAFMRSNEGTISIFAAPSGEAPRLLVETLSNGFSFINDFDLAVAPDGSALAFFAEREAERGVFTANVETGEIRFIATAYNGALGEGGEFYDPAETITLRATGASNYQYQFALAWGEYGILHTPANDVGKLALSSPEGGEIWGVFVEGNVIFDEEARHVAGWDYTLQAWSLIDIETGELSALELPENAKPIGWVGDDFFYRTRTDLISVTGNMEILAGNEVFDYNWGFTATSANLNIYLDMPDDEDELVTTLQGYDIGFVEGTASNRLFVYYVSSSVPAVLALNEGASPDDVRPLRANPEMLLLQVAYKEEVPNAVGRFPFTSPDAVESNGDYILPESD